MIDNKIITDREAGSLQSRICFRRTTERPRTQKTSRRLV